MDSSVLADSISTAIGRAASYATAGSSDGIERLRKRARIWESRSLTRELYEGYYRAIDTARSTVAGRDLEIGSGHGGYGATRPGTITSDIIPCPWLDLAVDATRLPFNDADLANIILVDVLHHIAEPLLFLREASRTLAPGGRVIMVEPYVSPLSWLAWKLFVDEECDTTADPFRAPSGGGSEVPKDPWAANVALPTLLFFRKAAECRTQIPELHIVERRRFDMLVMPLSGGFEKTRLIPLWLVPLLKAVERRLSLLQPLMAFRCMIVLERTSPA